mgnify:CR=1 FL=1
MTNILRMDMAKRHNEPWQKMHLVAMEKDISINNTDFGCHATFAMFLNIYKHCHVMLNMFSFHGKFAYL